jgi:uncharacterized protein (TIGR02757 family)
LTLTQKEIGIKKKLESHYKYFDCSKISPDPIEFPHRFSNYYDIEISAFISSLFAYGNLKQIMSSLEKIHNVMKNNPFGFVKTYNYEKHAKLFKSVKHRFYTGNDIIRLFLLLNDVYKNYSSLKNLFLLYHSEKDINLKESISLFSNRLLELMSKSGEITQGIKFMFPDPAKRSACKRMNLFLRWMVRKDELDFGIWNEISPSQLVIPVDTHVAKICKQLKLTKQKNVSWKMAEEITGQLKKFDRNDPVKYDFAICHIGMRKLKF